jgi:hypothetical protein
MSFSWSDEERCGIVVMMMQFLKTKLTVSLSLYKEKNWNGNRYYSDILDKTNMVTFI